MNLSNTLIVARYSARLLQRNWVFRFCIATIFVFITAYLLINISNIIGGTGAPQNTNRPDSFFPYLTVYLLNILQIFPIIFLAGAFYGKEQKLDTMDSVDIRSMSNLEYISGIAWGMLKTFMFLDFIVLVTGALIDIFGTDGTFNPFLYLFYYFTLALPSLIFIIGLSFFINGLLRNRALYIIVMLGVVIISVFFTGNLWHGALNPLGMTLPGAFSEITGHSDIGSFLLQRACWLFIGIGMLAASVALYKRLPNKPNDSKKQLITATFLTITGLVLGLLLFYLQISDSTQRNIYTSVYNKYSGREKLTLLSQEIEYTQHDSKMEVISRLVVENKNATTIKEGVLYLNPNLKVLKIEEGGKNISFTRDHQTILINRDFLHGDSVELIIHYKGGIDENIAYLNVPKKQINDNSPNALGLIYYGKKYAFLDSDYTLLIPEVLWYPVTVPPVNPAVPCDLDFNFTRYRLTVNNTGDKTAISQGTRKIGDGNVIFEDKNPLKGISLIIGDYTRFGIAVDSIEYEMYLFKKHDDLFEEFQYIKDTLSSIIALQIDILKMFKGATYHFDHFLIVESPVTFASYYRSEFGKSEMVQPEIVLLPELGWNGIRTNIKEQKRYYERFTGLPGMPNNDVELEMALVNNMISWLFAEFDKPNTNKIGDFFDKALGKALSDLDNNKNKYNITSLCFQDIISYRSRDYPIMNILIPQLIQELMIVKSQTIDYYYDALDYLSKNSLQDAVSDIDIDQVLIRKLFDLKIEDLRNKFGYEGINETEFSPWINNYNFQNVFRQINFEQFNSDFKTDFGIDWLDFIPQWYLASGLPRFEFADMKVEEVDKSITGEYTSTVYRVEFCVHNDSDIDGVINIKNYGPKVLYIGNTKSTNLLMKASFFEKYISVKAGEAKHVAFLTEDNALMIGMPFSDNLPIALQIPSRALTTRDTSQFEQLISSGKFITSDNEIIIDDSDSEFTIVGERKSRKLMVKGGKRSKFEKSLDVEDRSKWAHALGDEFYGRFERSATVKFVNNSSAYAEWSSEIDKSGEYEVFVCSSGISSLGQFGVTDKGFSRLLPTETKHNGSINQHYTVIHEGGEESVSIDLSKQEDWVSLGKYQFNSGTFRIRLLDKGETNQLLYADAVKLVYIGSD